MTEASSSDSVLELKSGAGAAQVFRLSSTPMVIGRQQPVEVCLASARVSRRHAQLQMTEEGRWTLQDLGSRNGTFVNGRRVSQTLLQDGDTIRLGDCELTLRLPEPQAEKDEPFLEFAATEAVSPEDGAAWTFVTRYASLVRRLGRINQIDALAGELCKGCVEICGARDAAVGVFKDGNVSWSAKYSAKTQRAAPPVGQAILKRLSDESVIYENLGVVVAASAQDGVRASGALVFPMRSGGQTHGVLYLEMDPNARPLRSEQTMLVRLVATETAHRMEQIRARDATEQQVRLVAELDAARRIQMGLFPETLDVDSRLRAGAINLPSMTVSGDHYDLIKVGGDHVFFIIADVMGCGLPAAMVMANVQAGFRMAAWLTQDLGAIHRLLGRLVERSARGMFVTGILGVLDLRDGSVSLSNAGHPSPLLVSDGLVKAIGDQDGTPPWGIDWKGEIAVSTARLSGNDDGLLLYTDGAFEACNAAGEELGTARLRKIVSETGPIMPQDAVESISHRILSWSLQSFRDDLTLLALKWIGKAPAKA